jgi:hypothetical protein
LNYLVGSDPVQNLGIWEETFDGQVRHVDLDLTPLEGKTVYFILKVYAESTSLLNVGAWILPSIWR